MTKRMTMEALMLPLIDDAANVFYSKLVSLLDSYWGESFVLHSWCGWHRHNTVGFKWTYGAFSSYKSDRKCVIRLGGIPQDAFSDESLSGTTAYLRAVYRLDLSRVIVDTTESHDSAGGAPVPTYRLDMDEPLEFAGYIVSPEYRDVAYGTEKKTLRVFVTDDNGDVSEETLIKDLAGTYFTVLIGEVDSVGGCGIRFKPVYNHAMLGSESLSEREQFRINAKTSIYPDDRYGTASADGTITQGTKYEWDCGRVLEFRDGTDPFWKYYSIDSDQTRWFVTDSSKPSPMKPDVELPVISHTACPDYFLGGACFRRDDNLTGADGKLFSRITIWRMSSHVYPMSHAQVFMRMTPYKAHEKERITLSNGKTVMRGKRKSEIERLGSQARRFLYAGGSFSDSVFSSLLHNCVFFTDARLAHRSAYEIMKKHASKALKSISEKYLTMLELACSNKSPHYSLDSLALYYRLATDAQKAEMMAERRLTNLDMAFITKHTSCIPEITAGSNGSVTRTLRWDAIWTPYLFVKNATASEYRAHGGTLSKFVNIGTEAEPRYYRIDRISDRAGDFGHDDMQRHHVSVELWSEQDINSYAQVTFS